MNNKCDDKTKISTTSNYNGEDDERKETLIYTDITNSYLPDLCAASCQFYLELKSYNCIEHIWKKDNTNTNTTAILVQFNLKNLQMAGFQIIHAISGSTIIGTQIVRNNGIMNSSAPSTTIVYEKRTNTYPIEILVNSSLAAKTFFQINDNLSKRYCNYSSTVNK